MMGLLHGNDTRPNITPKQLTDLSKGNQSHGMPQFTIRRASNISANLSQVAVVRGYQNVPVYNSIDDIWVDDLQLDACKYPLDMEAALRL
jgi:hypothetical protein